jgi:serine/threonine protein phosphatase 1
VPDKTYVMTDIHGRLAPLKALLAQIPDGAKIVFLGDYIDRGSESREVVELVRSLQAKGAVCLRGNHEDMICAPDPHMWLDNGGASTVLSYKHPLTGELDAEALQHDLDWFQTLPRYHEDAARVYVHAGVHPAYDLIDQPEAYTQWFRYPEGYDGSYRGKMVVHGHTPGVFQGRSRVCLDAGQKRLCCGMFDDHKLVGLLWA